MTTYDPTKNRPAKNPGGCECRTCGAIFIGEEWHTECAVCLKARRERIAAARDPETFTPEEREAAIRALTGEVYRIGHDGSDTDPEAD
jgi:hypothetical protein